ncbi:MAG: amidophosphoribosyltransferase [Candidatus Anammoxibacter sp.]
MKEECGIFGIFCRETEISRLIYFGLFALQHRGQESAGITVSDGFGLSSHKDIGLVNQVFQSDYELSNLRGHIGIGHVRYSTTGASKLSNAQPLIAVRQRDSKQMEIDFPRKGPYHNPDAVMALGHNGNLLNANKLRQRLEEKGYRFQTSSDSEAILYLIEYYAKKSTRSSNIIEEAISKCMKDIKGAYSLVIMTPEKLFAVRDPKGIRPLCLGYLPGTDSKANGSTNDGYVVASETCALDIVGARYIREIEPGECCVIHLPDKPESIMFKSPKDKHNALCIFELIYFARPDSEFNGILIEEVRERLGKQLAKEYPIDADFVMPVPESGITAASGYAEEHKSKCIRGLIKNRYVMRTFILPDQHLREVGIKLKLNPLKQKLKDKRIILIDDSIVRGTTSAKIVRMLREAGAKEIHMLISCPPIKYPCFYGIDTANKDELIASNRNEDEICKYIGADSLHFLSQKGLLEAVHPAMNSTHDDGNKGYCTACFDGKYPVPIPGDVKMTKFDLEEKGN